LHHSDFFNLKWKALTLLRAILVLLLFACIQLAKGQNLKVTPATITRRMIGNPLEHLPPDNKSIAFMAKTFGDAMVIDLQTRNITCLTCAIPAAAFVRVVHLSNGDYLLVGPEHFENAQAAKGSSELWYLNKKKGSKPLKLGVKLSEGLAISKRQLKIAYTQPGSSPEIISQIIVADFDIKGD